jgi:membrane protease subunit HflC
LEAYRSSFKTKQDLMVLEPNSDFFKFMKSSRPLGGYGQAPLIPAAK